MNIEFAAARRPSLWLLAALLACAAGPAAAETAFAASRAGAGEGGESEAQIIAAIDPAGSLFFAPGDATIDEAGEDFLRRQAERLKAEPRTVVTLIGYSDDLGSRAYDLAIAEQRVSQVFARLQALGVPVRQIRRYSVGIELTRAACRSPACRALMRRVEFKYPQ